MNKLRYYFLILIINAFLFSSLNCVSVKLDPKYKPANNYKLNPPNLPFTSSANKDLKDTWINKSTGSSISVFSNCEEQEDVSLKQITQDALSPLEELTILKQNPFQQGANHGLQTIAEGKLDGHKFKSKIIALHKENCYFTLTFNAYPESFDSDIKEFEVFFTGFHLL